MINFQDSDEATQWSAINDDVMGCVSAREMRIESGIGVFSGKLFLKNGDGFASMHRTPRETYWSHLWSKALEFFYQRRI